MRLVRLVCLEHLVRVWMVRTARARHLPLQRAATIRCNGRNGTVPRSQYNMPTAQDIEEGELPQRWWDRNGGTRPFVNVRDQLPPGWRQVSEG